MSRVGKHPVAIPEGVEVAISGVDVTVKGQRGELAARFTRDVDIAVAEREVVVTPRGDGNRARAMWGTARSVIDNMVTGVSKGFEVVLEISGVGYRAAVQDDALVLQLGYSHEIRYPIPEGIEIACPRPTQITVAGADRQRVGQVAAEIRGFRKPEPYKGKGIRYADERVRRKEGKKK